jgi:VIT1/CCC1 family predicted Fe2+/Mn2+ transporter
VRDALISHLGSRQVARVVYGAVIGLALLVGLEQHPPRAGVMTVWMLATGLAVALAELYSEAVGVETRERHRITRKDIAEMLDDAAAVAFGVAFPAIFFALAAFGAIELETAFRLARWTGLGLLGFYAFCAARLAGNAVTRAILHALSIVAVGAFVIAIKALIH